MSLETSFPFLSVYWPHVLALVVSYIVAVYFIKATNPESENKIDNEKMDKKSTLKPSKGKKRYLSPDQG